MDNMVFYNFEGKPIAYCEDKEKIYLFSGEPVAYFHNDYVYDYDGNELGWFRNGWIRDLNGACVFFTADAIGGMVKPVREVLPVKGVKWVAPVKSFREVPQVKAVEQLSWSRLSNEAFFRQK